MLGHLKISASLITEVKFCGTFCHLSWSPNFPREIGDDEDWTDGTDSQIQIDTGASNEDKNIK